MDIELFVVFSYYSFNVFGVCSDVPPFISDIGNLCLHLFSVCLEVYQLY